jgi:hypothetical protein
MGKLMRLAGRVLGTGVLVLAGTGVLVLAEAGVATAQTASTITSTDACDTFFAELGSFEAVFKENPSQWGPVAAAAVEFAQVASTAPPAVMSAISTFVADLRADVAARRVISRPKLVADGDAIVAACSAQPSGAPATGGGSTAGVQDPALFGLGGAAVLAGLGVLGLARRSPGHG